MTMEQRIRARLTAALAPAALDIVDESHLHAGHRGAPAGGQSHYRVRIVAAAFRDASRVARQRMVYGALGDEFADGLHALALRTLTPEEAGD